MNCELTQRFIFDAAYTVDGEIDAEPSRCIHGHTYGAKVGVTGIKGEATGMVVIWATSGGSSPSFARSGTTGCLMTYGIWGSPPLENLCLQSETVQTKATFRSVGVA
jgi:6-pyruvoyltetrahydropterin/6-carboxytetrahydropterin synthase